MGSFKSVEKSKRRGGQPGKIDAPLDKKLQAVKWGKFRLGDLFEIVGTKSLDSNAINFVHKGINFVGRTFENNGIQGFIEQRDFEPNEPFTITATVIGNYKYVKYQKELYYCSQNIDKLTPKEILSRWNEYIAYFFVTLIQKFVSFYDGQQGGYKLDDIKNHIITIPITSTGYIDFDFMESFIREIEEERMCEIDAYLLTTGLKDYALTAAEQTVLEEFEHVKWGKFRLGDLFEKIKVNSLKYKTSDLPNIAQEEYDLPALTAGIQNQGLNNYVPRKNATVLKNVISISANGANTGATFYQSKEFTVLQDAYAIRWIYSDKILTDDQSLFLVSAISKRIYGSYEWTNKAGWERIKNDSIQLPITSSDEIDVDFMETFISAVQKLVIKDVVQYADKRIAPRRNW
ncbi:MAG: restriction endonuclease subunit S [Paludibacteraceae bacterium]